jgi:hypothetical protein
MTFSNLFLKFCCFIWAFQRALFYRDLSDSLDRMVGVRDFLDRQISNSLMLRDWAGVRVYRAMARRYAAGEGATFAQLVRGIAPASDQMLMKAVDDAGAKTSEALCFSADAIDFQLRSIRTTLWELLQPFAFIILVAILSSITADVVASIAAEAPADIWVGFNGFVRWLAETITSYGSYIAVGLVGSLIAFLYALPRWIGSNRLRFDSWPGFGLYRDYNAAVVLSSLAMLLSSGRSVREGMEALHGSASPWLRWHIKRILSSLDSSPSDYKAAFARGLMPKSVLARLANRLDSKVTFAEAMIEIATKEVDALETRVKYSAAISGYSLVIVIGAIGVVLGIGVMTMSTALMNASDQSRVIQRSHQAR